MNSARTLIAALTLCGPSIAATAAEKPPEVLEGGPWQLHYADDSCRLARTFGTGKDRVEILLEFFVRDGGYQLTLAGERFETMYLRPPMQLGWGPGLGKPVPVEFDSGTINKMPMVVGRGLPVDNFQSPLIDGLPSRMPPSPEQEAVVRDLTIRFEKRTTVLKTGSMRAAMDSARRCLDELETHWGLDPAEQARIVRRPQPTEHPARWLRPEDYPRLNMQAIVHFRLIVGTDGKPQSCAIQAATKGKPFAEATCRILMERGRFEPARDAAGNPVRAPYVNAVRWISG